MCVQNPPVSSYRVKSQSPHGGLHELTPTTTHRLVLSFVRLTVKLYGFFVYLAHQSPLSTEVSRQECWSREWVAFPFSRGFPNPGIKPRSPTLQADCLLSEPPGKPVFGVLTFYHIYNSNYFLTSSRLLFNFVDFSF